VKKTFAARILLEKQEVGGLLHRKRRGKQIAPYSTPTSDWEINIEENSNFGCTIIFRALAVRLFQTWAKPDNGTGRLSNSFF